MAFIYGKLLGCNRIIIEVNPRHVSFYESSLGFQVMSEERLCPRVNVPAVLLMLDVAHTIEQTRKFGGRYAVGGKTKGGDRKNLYRYFLSEADEQSLVARLLATVDTTGARRQLAGVLRPAGAKDIAPIIEAVGAEARRERGYIPYRLGVDGMTRLETHAPHAVSLGHRLRGRWVEVR